MNPASTGTRKPFTVTGPLEDLVQKLARVLGVSVSEQPYGAFGRADLLSEE